MTPIQQDDHYAHGSKNKPVPASLNSKDESSQLLCREIQRPRRRTSTTRKQLSLGLECISIICSYHIGRRLELRLLILRCMKLKCVMSLNHARSLKAVTRVSAKSIESGRSIRASARVHVKRPVHTSHIQVRRDPILSVQLMQVL